MPLISTKRVQIDRANLHMLIAVSAAVFVLVFTLVAAKALVSQHSYQSKIISKKQVAKDTLDANIKNVQTLVTSYQTFNASAENVIGGSASGTSDRDGENARIALDALPSKYDFPALTSSLEKILTSQNFKIDSITGTDDEANQAANQQSANPVPIEMPFEVTVATDFSSIQTLLGSFEKSIRPIQVHAVTISSAEGGLTVNVKANTYYQPEKIFEVRKETVK